MSSSESPLEVKILEDYIKGWKKVRGGILLFPKDHLHFDKLLIQTRFILFDRFFDLSGIIELVPPEKMNEDSKRLYQSMVELQCELSWGGFLKRRPYFKSYDGIIKLREHIPSLNVNDKLTSMLNSSDDVLKFLRKIRPYELFVTLSTFTHPPRFEADPIIAHVKSYYDPSEVTWVISLSIGGSRLGGYKKRFINVCKLMDSMGKIVLKAANLR